MNEDDFIREQLLSAILLDSLPISAARLKRVQPIISEKFMVPEIDIPRMEACSCYIIEASTACITLTSHLLERYCKELLIQVDFGPSFLRMNFQLDDSPPPDLSVYLNKELSSTLRACKAKGFLSKETWKQLDKYKDIFRNGFSHYDPAQILKGLTYKFSTQKSPGEPLKEREFNLHDIPNVGLAIEAFAEKNAWPYLVTVENFIRSTIQYFHNPNIDPGWRLVLYE
jgi:hypothetical protein